MTPPPPLRSLLLVLLGLVAACSTQSRIDESRRLAGLGDHLRAFDVLDTERRAQLAGGGQVDPELEREWRVARLRFLLERARERIFGEREDEALRDLELIEIEQPDYPELARLRARALEKKAGRLAARGDELLAEKDYAGAVAKYLESQRIVPGFEPARAGMENVRENLERMNLRARQQLLEAIRKLPEFRFAEVQWHSGNAIHNDPDSDEAKELKTKAQRENARSLLARAAECEGKNQFGAALMLYRNALRLQPDLEVAREAIGRMQRELEALALVDKAQVEMRSGRFDETRALLAKAFEQSELARPSISELMLQTRKIEAEHAYRAARDLEVMGRKQEALAAFLALSKDWPEGIEDEQARIRALQIDIEGAAQEWAAAEAAEAAGDLQKAIEHYQQSERYYADWRDGKARIERLRGEVAKEPPVEPDGR